jgi:cell division protein FtsB
MRYAFTVVMAGIVIGMLIWATRPIIQEERRWRLVWAVFAVVFVFGALSFTWIQTLSERAQDQAEDNCHAAEDFRSLLANSRTFELRELQARRDNLADEISHVSADVESTPGFLELPEPMQRFLRGLVASEIADAEAQLAEYDAQLVLARSEVDVIRRFVLAVDCPGEPTEVIVDPPVITFLPEETDP